MDCLSHNGFPQMRPIRLIEVRASPQSPGSQCHPVVGCRLHGPLDWKVGLGETCSLWTDLIHGMEIAVPALTKRR